MLSSYKCISSFVDNIKQQMLIIDVFLIYSGKGNPL